MVNANLETALQEIESILMGRIAMKDNPAYKGVSYGLLSDEPKQILDVETRKATESKLQDIYEDSEWYSVRYHAGEVLRKEHISIDSWLTKLSNALDSTRTVVSYETWTHPYSGNGLPLVEERFETEVPDMDSRFKALDDAGKLYEFSRSLHLRRLLNGVLQRNDIDVQKRTKKMLWEYFKEETSEKYRLLKSARLFGALVDTITARKRFKKWVEV